MDRTLPEDVAELFRVPPERFVAARDERVKQLRTDGRDEDAAAVKALRKPTVLVWALNQLADREAPAVAALFETGRDLRAAQQVAVSGGGADSMLAATVARRDAVARLTAAAAAILDEAGHGSASHADAMSTALETASIDAEVGAHLAAGTLQTLPAAPAGFGPIARLTGLPGGAHTERQTASDVRTPQADVTRLRHERDVAAKLARNRRAKADRLAREIEDLRSHLDRLEVGHAEAEARALESELEAERATHARSDAVDQP